MLKFVICLYLNILWIYKYNNTDLYHWVITLIALKTSHHVNIQYVHYTPHGPQEVEYTSHWRLPGQSKHAWLHSNKVYNTCMPASWGLFTVVHCTYGRYPQGRRMISIQLDCFGFMVESFSQSSSCGNSFEIVLVTRWIPPGAPHKFCSWGSLAELG